MLDGFIFIVIGILVFLFRVGITKSKIDIDNDFFARHKGPIDYPVRRTVYVSVLFLLVGLTLVLAKALGFR